MGQFASTAFNGDPYIDIMRALPDRELIWWIQKVIWLAQGFTVVEHFGRTYHQLFVHKCDHCNGAGTMICPSCSGYKIKRANQQGFRYSEQTNVGRLLAQADTKECEQCGGYCPWDDESEWQGKWEDWESKLAYYDRGYGALMDEFYDDVVNEGNLDEDTPHEDESIPPLGEQGPMPEIDREIAKMKKRTKALLDRMGGHPYDHDDMIPSQIIDITKSVQENLDSIRYNRSEFPPELHPEAFPEYLLLANSPIAAFNHQIRMEYLIFQNLDAAIKDQPKPAVFEPSAGTVPCPECRGTPYYYSFIPNVARMTRSEPPFWLRTLSNMQQRNTWRHALPTAAVAGLEGAEEKGEEASTSSGGRRGGAGRQFGEIPRQPPKDEAIQALLDSSNGLWQYTPGSGPKKLIQALGSDDDQPAPDWFNDFGTRISLPGATSTSSAIADLSEDDPLRALVEQDFGARDPLSADPAKALGAGEALSRTTRGKNPISGQSAFDAQWIYSNLNPAKNLARKVRDLRVLDEAENSAQEEAIMEWLQTRDSLAPDFQNAGKQQKGKAVASAK